MATLAVVDQGQRFLALMHWNGLGDDLVGHGVEHGVAGAIRGMAGAPFAGAAEVARGNQAVGGFAFRQRQPLAVDDYLMIPRAHPAPGYAPGGQFTDRLGRDMGE